MARINILDLSDQALNKLLYESSPVEIVDLADGGIRHQSIRHPYHYLQYWLKIARALGDVVTHNNSYGELEKRFSILVKRLVVAERRVKELESNASIQEKVETSKTDRININGSYLLIAPKGPPEYGNNQMLSEREFLVDNILNFLKNYSDTDPHQITIYELKELNDTDILSETFNKCCCVEEGKKDPFIR